MNLVQVNGTSYVVNLWWQVRVGSVSRNTILLAARETARELQGEAFTCVAIRPHQYGLGANMPEALGFPALATALRPQVQAQQGFLGVFRLNTGWWVCGISRGSIAASGDRLFADEADARAHLRQLRDLFGASEEVVCESIEASEQYLLPLLVKDSLTAAVELLFPDPSRRRWLLRGGVLALVVLMAGYGGKWLWDAKVQESAIINARQLMQSKESRRREILADPGSHFEQSWLTAPPVLAVRGQCLPELMAVPLSASGWALDSALCRPSGLTLQWGHRPGASYTRLPQDARLADPKKAMTSRKLATLSPRGTDAPLITKDEAIARLYENTRRMSCRLKLNWAAPEKKTVDEVEVTAPWVRGNWQFEAVPSVLLVDVFHLLSTIPGLSVSEIVLDKSWTVKGVVYATVK